jgi:hypothetical protein
MTEHCCVGWKKGIMIVGGKHCGFICSLLNELQQQGMAVACVPMIKMLSFLA